MVYPPKSRRPYNRNSAATDEDPYTPYHYHFPYSDPTTFLCIFWGVKWSPRTYNRRCCLARFRWAGVETEKQYTSHLHHSPCLRLIQQPASLLPSPLSRRHRASWGKLASEICSTSPRFHSPEISESKVRCSVEVTFVFGGRI